MNPRRAQFNRVRRRREWRSRPRLAACPACQPHLFDGSLRRTPVAVVCAEHLKHPVAEMFLTADERR